MTASARRRLHARRAAAARWGHANEARELGRQMAGERVLDALRDYRRQYGEPRGEVKARMLLFVDGTPMPGS
jgi:hypothetical protein